MKKSPEVSAETKKYQEQFNLPPSLLIKELEIQCHLKDIGAIEYIIKELKKDKEFYSYNYKYETTLHSIITSQNDVSIVKALFDSIEISKITSIDRCNIIDSIIINACPKNNKNMIEYIFSDELIKYINEVMVETTLLYSGSSSDTSIISFLHDCENIQEFINENTSYEDCLNLACEKDQVEIIKYLLHKTSIKDHVDEESILKYAYANKSMKITEYLIIEYDIIESKKLKKYMKDKPQLQSLFNNRHLNNVLNYELNIRDENENKQSKKLKL